MQRLLLILVFSFLGSLVHGQVSNDSTKVYPERKPFEGDSILRNRKEMKIMKTEEVQQLMETIYPPEAGQEQDERIKKVVVPPDMPASDPKTGTKATYAPDLKIGTKAIYDNDPDRLRNPDVVDEAKITSAILADPDFKRSSFVLQSIPLVFILVHKNNITELPDGSFELDTFSKLGPAYQLCEQERFRNEPIVGFCTAFAVDHKRLVTAGHCLNQVNYQNFYAVNGFVKDPFTNRPVSKIAARYVYEVEEVVESPGGLDMAVLTLSRPIEYKGSFFTNGTDPIPNSQVFSMGHPLGLPLKSMWGGRVKSTDQNAFYCTLDAYQGCSGSPVFDNETFAFMGMLTSGAIDFERKGNCNVSRMCYADCKGEKVLKISLILPWIRN